MLPSRLHLLGLASYTLSDVFARHDRFFAGIEKLRRHADPKSRTYNEGVSQLVKSINDTLVSNIR